MIGKIFNKVIFAARLSALMADRNDTIYTLGEYLHLSPSSISKYTNGPKGKRIPILGTIAAGAPILAEQHIESYMYVSNNCDFDFCLKVKGDSMMNARILDGDCVFIRIQSDVENGEIAAVLVDGENATLKRVHKMNGAILLRSENPNYPDMVFQKKDHREVCIIGKAKAFMSEVR